MRYEEAKGILDVLTAKLSSIPAEMKAEDIASLGKEFDTAYDDKLLVDVARRMLDKGYSQIPVKNRKNGRVMGIVTELLVLKLLLLPRRCLKDEFGVEDLKELKVKSLREPKGTQHVPTLEEIPQYPHDDALQSIANALLHHYYVIVEKDGEVIGIITRADFLKILGSNKK